nr:isocitrate lyase/phosphoenolpyruvate mutase family protein [Pseudorhodobacter ferrugineus]
MNDKAKQFHALHQRGNPLVLYNIWDAGSAKAVVDAGAVAVATGSWSVAAAQGYSDGEAIPLALLVQIVGRIAASVDVPLSVDFEGAYAVDPDRVAQNVAQIAAAGAVGINLEDQIIGGTGLHSIEVQVARIAAAKRGGDLFINARTDVFLQEPDVGRHAGLVDAAIARGVAYAGAGADGFFVPGLTDSALIGRICAAVDLPVNAMRKGDMQIADLTRAGVGRLSHGPGPYREAMGALTERCTAAVG